MSHNSLNFEDGGLTFWIYPFFCHTRAPSWILSQAENLTCFSLQDGATNWYYFLPWTTHPPPTSHSPTHPQLSFSCKCCAMSSPQQSMCGVPPSQYMLSFKVVRCPHPLCYTHQEGMCGVPPFQYKFFCAVSPPM